MSSAPRAMPGLLRCGGKAVPFSACPFFHHASGRYWFFEHVESFSEISGRTVKKVAGHWGNAYIRTRSNPDHPKK